MRSYFNSLGEQQVTAIAHIQLEKLVKRLKRSPHCPLLRQKLRTYR